MAASTVSRNTTQADIKPIPDFLVLPIAASTTLYQGTMIGLNSAGYAVAAGNAATPIQKVLGRADGPGDTGLAADVDNSAGTAGAKTVRVRQGAFWFKNNGSSIASTDVGKPCFAADDISVDLADGAGSRPHAGIILAVDSLLGTSSLGVLVLMGAVPQFAGTGGVAATGSLSAFKARAVVTANASLTAFVGVTGGSSTDSDGVLAVAGNIVLLTAQTTAAQNGPYLVGTVTAGTAPLTRPSWFAAASTQPSGFTVHIGGEGTVYKNTVWKAFVAASTFVVDTTDGKFYPLSVSFSAALVAGTLTAGVGATAGAPANLAVFSTSSNLVITRRTANTTAATIAYALNGNPTPGVPGTGAIAAMATVAAGTINAADISTLNLTLINQV